MLPDRVSNPGPLTYESGALSIALRGPAYHSLVKIQLKAHKIKGHLFICTLQCILLYCDTICDSAVFHDCSRYLREQR